MDQVKIFLIGEAPGAKEDQLGEPFVGASGKFLKQPPPPFRWIKSSKYLPHEHCKV
jgi:hypothetical protein